MMHASVFATMLPNAPSIPERSSFLYIDTLVMNSIHYCVYQRI
jgi:hypothetical protein